MTFLVVLLLGAGMVLIASALETNPDGSPVSILATISQIWNGTVDFSQPAVTNGPTGPTQTPTPQHPIPAGTQPTLLSSPATTFVGGAGGAQTAYRASVVRSWVQSRQAGTI